VGQEPPNLGVHPQGRASSVWQPGGPGGPLVGYFPEFVNIVQWHASELCNVADMIALAIRRPLYQRRHYRDGEPRLRTVTRFVSSENVDW